MDNITDLLRRVEQLEALGGHAPQWVYPNDPEWVGTAGAPLTSTSWDGDAHSTEAKTLIDLSAVFGVPAGVKAVLVHVAAQDSDSTTAARKFYLSPVNTSLIGPMILKCERAANDDWVWKTEVVPCDANGDLYSQVVASGVGTMDVYVQIYGYELP